MTMIIGPSDSDVLRTAHAAVADAEVHFRDRDERVWGLVDIAIRMLIEAKKALILSQAGPVGRAPWDHGETLGDEVMAISQILLDPDDEGEDDDSTEIHTPEHGNPVGVSSGFERD